MPREPQFITFFGNLIMKTLENLTFSDIFWKLKSIENIVFPFKFLSFPKKKSQSFCDHFRSRNISLLHIFRYSKISENSRKPDYVFVVCAIKSKQNMTLSVGSLPRNFLKNKFSWVSIAEKMKYNMVGESKGVLRGLSSFMTWGGGGDGKIGSVLSKNLSNP